LFADGLKSSFIVPPRFSDTYTNKIFPNYINRRFGQRNCFLIYAPTLVYWYEIARNA